MTGRALVEHLADPPRPVLPFQLQTISQSIWGRECAEALPILAACRGALNSLVAER